MRMLKSITALQGKFRPTHTQREIEFLLTLTSHRIFFRENTHVLLLLTPSTCSYCFWSLTWDTEAKQNLSCLKRAGTNLCSQTNYKLAPPTGGRGCIQGREENTHKRYTADHNHLQLPAYNELMQMQSLPMNPTSDFQETKCIRFVWPSRLFVPNLPVDHNRRNA